MAKEDRYNFKYYPEMCDKLIKLMEKGLPDMQIAAKLKISYPTFKSWLDKYTEFKEAYELADPLRFDYIMEQGDKIFLTGEAGPNDKGYKHWLKKTNYIYKNYDNEAGRTTGTTIQIGSMNVLNQKSDSELLEILNANLDNLKLLPD